MNTGRSGKCGNTGRECGKVQLKASNELVISKLFEHEIRTLDSGKVEETEQNHSFGERNHQRKKNKKQKNYPLPRG